MSPADFALALEHKSFTSKKADLDAVCSLYTRSYTQRFAKAKTLLFMGLAWGDAEVAVLAARPQRGETGDRDEHVRQRND